MIFWRKVKVNGQIVLRLYLSGISVDFFLFTIFHCFTVGICLSVLPPEETANKYMEETIELEVSLCGLFIARCHPCIL